MQSSGYLEWGPKLETGIEEIDEQHKILVEMCNEANRKLQDHVDKEFVERIVHDLMSYALYHFDQEEDLMETYGYEAHAPQDEQSHIAEHRSFSDTVSKVSTDLAKGQMITREALMYFLNNWLVNHIMNTDMRLAKFLLVKRGATPQ